MKRIDIPGVGLVDFPDSMTDADISSAIETDILKTAAQPEKVKEESGNLIKDAASYIGKNALKLPAAIADQLRNKSAVDGMDGKEVTPNQRAKESFDQVIADNKKPNTLKPGAKIVDGLPGIAEVGFNRGYAGLGRVEAGLIKAAADLTESENLSKLAESQNKYADEIEGRAVLRGTPVEGFAKESIVQDFPEAGANAISSVMQTAPSLVVGAATGGSGLPAMFGSVALQEYNEGRNQDKTPLQSAFRAAPMAGAEVLGEKLGGFEKLSKGLRNAVKGNGVADLGAAMIESSLRELPSEELTTTLQFLIDKTPEVGLNQGATFDDYKKAVKDTALATILQSSGMGVGGAILTNIANKLDAPKGSAEALEVEDAIINTLERKYNQTNTTQEAQPKLTISQGNLAADEATAAALQAQYDAETAKQEADAALAAIPEATSVDDAIKLASETINAPIESGTGLLSQVNQYAAEAIPAADILGDDNVSDLQNDVSTELANSAIESADNNAQGSVGNLSDQLNTGNDTRRTDNPAETLAQSSGADISTGNTDTGDDAVNRPFAQATDDFLPQMRNMTVDPTVIKQIDDELALRGLSVPENNLSATNSNQTISKPEIQPAPENELSVNPETAISNIQAPIEIHPAVIEQQTIQPLPKAVKPAAQKQNKPKTLLATLRDLGGVSITEKQDITGEQRGFAPGGYNQIFKKASNRSLKGLIESGDLDEYLPYNMRLETNGANDDAFDSTEAYDYLSDKIRNGDQVLPYEAQQEFEAAAYEARQNKNQDDNPFGDDDNPFDTIDANLTDEDVERIFNGTANDAARESDQVSNEANTENAIGDTGSNQGQTQGQETNAGQQAQVTDLLGDDTRNKQALADAERAKDAKRNSGADNQEGFTLTGSTSEADQAIAAGAQSLFDAPANKKPKQEAMPRQDFESTAGVGKISAVKERYSDKFGISWASTDIASAETMESAAAIAKAVAESGADNIADMRKVALNAQLVKPETQQNQGLHFNNGMRAFEKGDPRVLPSYYTDKAGKNAKDWYRGWDAANLDAPIQSAPAETQQSKDQARFADNKVFTSDKVAAARARLKSKLNTLNSGIDPELLIDGMTIAGAYIESGVRKFSAYAKAMTDDFGDSIKPYLLSFYEAARAYPGIDKEGMTDFDTASAEHQALLTPAVLEQAKEVIGQGLVESDKAKAKPNGQLKLTQDWGVDDINGYDSDRDDGAGGKIKTQFLNEAKKYLNQVANLLEAEGYEPHKDQRGRLQKAVSVNESGIASSGEVSLTMRKGNVGVHVDIGTSAIRGVTGNHPQGVSVMIRATDNAETDRFATKGQNIWLSTDLNATELANKLMQTAERYVKNTLQAEQGANDARTNQTEQVQPGRAQGNLLTEQPWSGTSEPMDARVGRASESVDAGRAVQGRVSETSGTGTQSTIGSNRNESPSGSREAGNAGNTTGTANPVNDFEITDETGIGEGSLAQKYNDNIAAIKLIKTLEAENRQATPEERNQLAKYNGFGALSKVFEKNNPKYQELKNLLTEEEYEAARASIRNAYYTSPAIVKSMYDAVSHLGFKGGRVLEPSLGSGNFFGMMPAALRNKSKLNGVELDVITSRLAKYLYPNANIAVATGFEKYQAPQGYFDLVISNPPFGSEQLRDSEKADYSGFSIHNFFIAKSIDKLRDDGIMAVVVSHSFMDAMDSRAREWISKRANLLGAVRLPNTAFKDNAGTEVITDILFFQKTSNPQNADAWINASSNGDYSFNDYFYANPRNVLGRITDTTSQFGKTFTIEPLPGNGTLAEQLKEFVLRLPSNVYVEPTQRIEVLDSADNTVPDSVKVGTFYTDETGAIRQRMPDVLGAKRSVTWEAPNAKAQERMQGMMKLRDLLRNQMRLERDPMASEKEIESNRKQLNKNYDDFVKKQGYLNSSTNRRLFMDDTESALLQALEVDYDQGVTKAKALATGMDEKPASAQKADIFKRRVLFPPSDSITVNNAKDALLASLNVKGIVDPDYMAEVYNKSAEEVIDELGDVVYNDPTKGYVTADEYLSGDVKTKLAEAKAKAATDSKYARNVEALEKVIPADKLPSEIYASAGANWIPADVYAQFASEITGIPVSDLEYNYVKATAMWLSDKTRNGDVGKMTAEFGTQEVNAFDLFNLLINGKAPEVKETIGYGADRRTVVNIEKTEAARSKYEKIKEAWNSWIFKDADRADRLATIYNEKHNRTVPRKFDGSHMQFYGMSPAITLRAHQKDVVWRAIQDRNVLLDHVVGAGKTMAMASIAMEMKRLGIARKPVFVVPNHLTLQWRSEFTKLYPASNILAATPEDFAKDKREKLFSKMVTGSYDAIIIGHSSLTKIGLPAEVEEKMYQEQVKELSDAIEAAKTARGDRGITRDMEKIKKNLEAKIDKLKEKAGKKDNVVTFDELGIDALFVDEMHEFKNLFFTTQMQRTAGLGNPAGSGKALDLFMKIKFMTETYGEDAPLITATGTPVSNSLAEMFTMQRYMKYQEMKRQDLHLFDAWAKQFGEVENVYEVAPSGVGYRQSTRFSKFKNLPALMGSYTRFADIITMQDLKDQTAAEVDPNTGKPKVFPVPKLKTGGPINVVAQRSELQRDFFGVPQLAVDENTGAIQFEVDPENSIIEQNKEGKYQIILQAKDENGDVIGRRSIGDNFDTKEDAELELVTKSLTPKTFIDPKSLLGQFANLAQLTRDSKGKINALSLTGLANKAGLDYRLINPSAPDFAGSKINKAVTNMVQLWKDTAKDKGTQIVFCDLSIPNSARNDMSSKERRIYVRDRDGELTHKAKGIVYAPEGFEGFPFYITKGRNGFEVYEAVSGTLVRDYGLEDKAAAKAWAASYVENESSRDRIFALRDTKTIDQTDIDEYRDANELELADDGSNEISTADLEAVAGSSKFSVYDDIKAKLIASGVPENQIAFIHDYNTPKKKEELFKRVNSGDVRFLFGSTPKLGAGTNVQKRLVGLHHIDAPWRPSDLEQREGRIIRQGNDLYARDPENFEISIWRYATEQTYDTRRWQLLEHKAAGIEQLRKYTGEAEISDVASEAANSADMKAAASGNPLILEETKLRNEVKRLINLEKAHADSQYAMARKIKSNASYITDYLPNKIAEYQDMISAVSAYPIPADKAKVAAMNVDGKVVSTREAAEEAIAALALKVRSLATMNETPKVIEYRGIKFTVERGMAMNSLKLSSPDGLMHTYGEKEGVSPSGLMTRFNNYIDSFESRIKDAEQAIKNAKAENESLKSRVNDPFEYTDQLKEAQAKHASVQRKLMKSSQLESVPENQRPEFDRLVKERKEILKKLGFEKALKESEAEDAPMFNRGSNPNGGMALNDFNKIIADSFGKSVSEKLVSKGVVKPLDNQTQLPAHVVPYLRDGDIVYGFFDPKTNSTYAVLENLTPDMVKGLILHEVGTHYGFKKMLGAEKYAQVIKQMETMRKAGSKQVKAAYAEAVKNSVNLQQVPEETIAYMVQNNPEIGFIKTVIAKIKAFLFKKFGISAGKLNESDITMLARAAVMNSVRENLGNNQGMLDKISAEFNRMNRKPSKDGGDTFLTAALEFTARNEGLFENPASDAKTVEGIAADTDTGFVVKPYGKSQTKLDKADKAWEIFMPNATYRSAVIYEKGDQVWINVSRLQSGVNFGSNIYSLAAAYAFNNNKVFIGDPLGLTDKAFYRRAENMLSSALKYGTTKHIAPHLAQEIPAEYYASQGNPEFGKSVRPINWIAGDDVHNIKELIYTVYKGAIDNLPELKNVIFNPDTQQFETVSGELFDNDAFERVLSRYYEGTAKDSGSSTADGSTQDAAINTPKKGNPYRAGIRTAKRAALFNTFLREQSAERRTALLGAYVRELQNFGLADSLKGVFYSRSTSQTNTPQFKAWFGNSKVVDADGKPLVVYHGTKADFSIFDKSKTERLPGFWMTPKTDSANGYAARNTGSNVMPLYVSIKNPRVYVVENEPYQNAWADYNAGNYDGFIMYGRGEMQAVVAKSSNQIKSAIGNNGDFDPNNPDIRFSRSNPQSRLTPEWKAPDASKFDSVVYKLQDKNIDLKRVTQAIKDAGNEISDRWNAYLQEELYHGRTAKRTQEFLKNDLEPLITEMRMRGVAMADFEEYLWARHAEERNIQIAKVNPDMPDGGSGMTTAEAKDYFANLSAADKSKYEALARRIDLINAKSRQVLIDYGLESAGTIMKWEGAYKHYVPLMREDMELGFGNGTGQGFSVKGNASKRATGSNRPVVDIIANIAQQYERNIIRGEKNRVATALIGLAKLNPNDDFWKVDTPPTIKSINKATGLVEEYTDPNYKNRDNVVVARLVNKRGEIEERSVIFNQFDERAMRMAAAIKNLDQDQIGEMLGMASGFTRYFASINTQYNPVFGVINITRDVQGALLNLSSTPLAGKQKEILANTGKAWLGIYKDLRQQRKTGNPSDTQWATLFEEFQREGGQTGYRDMYANAKDRSEALRNSLDPTWWKDSKIGKVISVNGVIAAPEQWMYDKAIKPIFDWLSDYNNSLENAVRLSVYKSALDAGQTKQQAASIAKNISVNFNRKGADARQIGALYAFFNASVQGTARIAENVLQRDNATGKLSLSKAGKVIFQGGLLLGAMQALVLAAAGYDDDEPPEFVRDRSLIIPLDPIGADGKYVTIPMPLGYNAIPATGRMITEWALSGGEDTGKRIVKWMNMLLDVTNPIGNAGFSLQTITPTVIDPFSALAENKDFTGRPIAREDISSLDQTPGFTRSRDKAWDLSVAIARGINWATGGTDAKQGVISPTADQLEYLAGQFTGGVGRETIKLGTTVDSLFTGEELPTYKIPLFGRFYGDTTGQSSQGSEFYSNVRKLNEHQAEIKLLQENDGDLDGYLQDNPEALYFKQADRVYRNISKLRKNQRILKEQGADKADIKAIDEAITELMTNFNNAIREAKEKEPA